MFSKFFINTSGDNLFNQLLLSAKFEDITKGRQGAVLVAPKDHKIPIVRTTTLYKNPAQQMLPIHYKLIDCIKTTTNLDVAFNNALIEVYDMDYSKMGYHTDQGLDLAEESYICVLSCYNNENTNNLRHLHIKNKTTGEISDITLENNSIILFSTSINQQFVHKITLCDSALNKPHTSQDGTKWLGITFRLSKTYIHYIDTFPYFLHNNQMLRLATEQEKHQFMINKRAENKMSDFKYPDIEYTLSSSDLLAII